MKRISLFLLVFVLISIACNAPARTLPSTPTPLPIDPAQADALEAQLATAMADLDAGNLVTLTITEAQLAAYIDRKFSQDPETPIHSPQVRLSDGKIEISSQITIEKLTAQAQLVFEAYVSEGRVQVRLLDAKLGALPVPDQFLDQINETMNNNMDALTAVDNRRIEVQQVSIEDGVMTLIGQLSQP